MSGTILGIDLNGIIDRWALTETKGDGSFAFGHSSIPPVVISPPSKGDKPLSGEQALNAIEGRGWVWPEEAAGPDNKGLCRRLPVIKLLQLMLEEKKKEVEVAKGEFISISQLLASHLRGLTQRRVDTAVVAIPDTADETFQQRIVDSRNETGFDKILLLWRPVASLLAWGQGLATNELEKLQETKTKALVVHLDALGLEVSVLTLDVEESSQGLLLTPVRSRIGRSLLGGQFRVLDFAQQLAENHSKRLLGDSLSWQMMWGCSFIWKGFLGHSESTDLFQNSKGEFVHLFQPNYEVPQDTVDDFIESYEDVLEEFEASELAQVRHVIADGPFLGLTCANNQTMAAILRRIVARGLGGRSSIPFHPLTGLQKDVVGNSAIARGAAIYAWRLAEGLPTYYDFLPQLEISAIVKGKPDFVALVPKQTKTAGGKEFGPYTVEQPFSIPAGLSELEFFIYKEGDQVKHTATKLKEPVNRETAVTLVVRQIPGQGHATVEIHPEQKGVFGPRVLNLDWESLTPTNKDKNAIIKESNEKAGICYPDSAPVATHERMWSASGATRAFEDYLESNLDPNVQISRYGNLLNSLCKVVKSKRRGSSLGLKEAENQVFSIVSSDGIVPSRLDTENSRFYRDADHKSPQELLSAAMDKLSTHFDQCIERMKKFPDRQGVTQTLFLTAAWCYSAAPENVVRYLLDYMSSGRKARVEPEAASRCINKRDHLLNFFSTLEKHFDSKTYHHNWVKGITQILQFREDSVGLLSDSQALKFTIMALNIIAGEIDRGNLKVKFLWGLQLLMLIFRYRIKHKDFLKSDSPHYGELHQIVKTILNGALQITEGKNKKARKYIQETIKMLDYKGTNLLIAQELASDIVSSNESEDTYSEQENYNDGLTSADKSKIAISESLSAFQAAISEKLNQKPEAYQESFSTPSKSPLFIRKPSTPPEPPPLVREPKQRETNTSSTDYKRIGIPPPDSIRFPLLYVINSMGGEIELFDAIGRIAAYFDIPPDELLPTSPPTIQFRLFQAMQDAAQMLFREKCIERSRKGFWKITATGIQELRRFKEIANQEAKSRQAAFLVPPLTKSTTQEPSTQLKSPELLKETQIDTKETQQNNSDLKIKIPPDERIKIPLLSVISEMGGQIELSQALPKISQYFNIRIEQPDNNTLSPTAQSLLKMMGYAASLLCFDNCLKRMEANNYEITATGTQLLQRSHKIGSRPDSSPHLRSSELPRESERLPKTPSLAVQYNKKTSIPSVGQIQIPLLMLIYQSGSQVDLAHTVDGLAKHFSIPNDRHADGTLSDAAQRLLDSIQRATNLLWVKGYVSQSQAGFWQITSKGIAKLTSPNLLRKAETEFHSTLSTSPQEGPNFEKPSSKSKSQQTVSRNELQNTRPDTMYFDLDAIPLPDLIRIPLLSIYAMGREIELCQATERIAEHFDIPSKYLNKNPTSSVEKRLLEAMQNAADLLRIEKYIERSRPGYWKITEKGLNWMKSSRKID